MLIEIPSNFHQTPVKLLSNSCQTRQAFHQTSVQLPSRRCRVCCVADCDNLSRSSSLPRRVLLLSLLTPVLPRARPPQMCRAKKGTPPCGAACTAGGCGELPAGSRSDRREPGGPERGHAIGRRLPPLAQSDHYYAAGQPRPPREPPNPQSQNGAGSGGTGGAGGGEDQGAGGGPREGGGGEAARARPRGARPGGAPRERRAHRE
eukprot:1060144-Prorocentrum_minimum.AAC.1